MLTFLPSLNRWGRAFFAFAGLALLTGCDLNFFKMDGHQSTINVEGVVAREQVDGGAQHSVLDWSVVRAPGRHYQNQVRARR